MGFEMGIDGSEKIEMVENSIIGRRSCRGKGRKAGV